MKNKVLLPAAAIAGIPLLWATLAPRGQNPPQLDRATVPSTGADPETAASPASGPNLGLSEVDGGSTAKARVALIGGGQPALEASSPEPGAPSAPALPTQFRLSEIGPDLGSRLNSRLALFEEPTDGMYASWYAGSSLEDIARVHFDGVIATNALAAINWTSPHGPPTARDHGLGGLVERRASFDKEIGWLAQEVNRRVELSKAPITVALATRSDEDLERAFPGPADRYVLGNMLRREYNSLVRVAAQDEFARVRAMSPEDRKKHSMPFMT